MQPWELLDEAKVPESGETLRLKRRGQEYSIMLGANELMNSRLSGSEEALATLTLEKLAGRRGPRVLIGGLGMGFTLRAALAVVDEAARITVAELVPSVIAWARGPMADLHAGTLDDPRVDIFQGDVGAAIRTAAAGYDAILLDVDNGPDGLSRPGNDTLYGAKGLGEARRALTPGGVLAVWSAHPSPKFTQRMKQAGFLTEEKPVRARGKSGAKHMIWLGAKAG
ncbi:spermidine synthase [Rhizobium sp.]